MMDLRIQYLVFPFWPESDGPEPAKKKIIITCDTPQLWSTRKNYNTHLPVEESYDGCGSAGDVGEGPAELVEGTEATSAEEEAATDGQGRRRPPLPLPARRHAEESEVHRLEEGQRTQAPVGQEDGKQDLTSGRKKPASSSFFFPFL